MFEPERPDPSENNPYFLKYIERVPEGDVRSILRVQLADTLALLRPLTEAQAGYRYAEGKWSIRQVIGHLTDTERVFTYRAMRFARADSTPLPGYDENLFAANGSFDDRSLRSLVGELEAVRSATAAFFHNLPEEAWSRAGVANNNPMSVRAIAFTVAGHELHHRELLQTRYLSQEVGVRS